MCSEPCVASAALAEIRFSLWLEGLLALLVDGGPNREISKNVLGLEFVKCIVLRSGFQRQYL
jgi:hypothetical protein